MDLTRGSLRVGFGSLSMHVKSPHNRPDTPARSRGSRAAWVGLGLAGVLLAAALLHEAMAHASDGSPLPDPRTVAHQGMDPPGRVLRGEERVSGVAWAADPATLSLRDLAEPAGEGLKTDRAAKGLPAYPKVIEAIGRGGAAATGHPLATRAAIRALRAGGTAVDAAVAAALTIGVVEPYHAGLGGGGFAVVYTAASKSSEVYDFRERAPLLTPPDANAVLHLRRGCTAVAIPGVPAGLWSLHQSGGRLPWETLFAEAVQAAEQGVVVGGLMAARIKERRPALQQDPDAARIFLNRGPGLRAGEVLKQHDLAMALRLLAKDGPAAFYGGPLSQGIVEGCRERGGLMRDQDFQDYRVRVGPAVQAQYGTRTFMTVGPPSIGGLQVLQLFGMAQHLGLQPPYGRPQNMHKLVEAMRLSFADRTRYASDGERSEVPFGVFLAGSSIQADVERISVTKRIPVKDLNPFNDGPTDGGTTHISVVDGQDNAVALTMTINFRFGAAVVGQGTGILLNDTMDDFSAPPGQSNAYYLSDGPLNTPAPGSAPLSSMSPTIVVEDGRPVLVLGGVGGPMIPTSVTQVLVNRYLHNMPLRAAVGVPRLHHQLLPDRIAFEGTHMMDGAREFLESRGHTLYSVRNVGTIYAVEVAPDGSRVAVADVRSHGAAAVELAPEAVPVPIVASVPGSREDQPR